MPNKIDAAFAALADPTRRAVIERLGDGPASVSALAAGFTMAMPSFLQHIRLLEGAGLVHTEKAGRVRTCTLEPLALAAVEQWIIERRFKQGPARVFAAFANEEGKARWFSGPNESWEMVDRHFDFRVGGTEHLEGKWQSGTVTRFDCSYHDIVPDRRIVYAYRMKLNGKPISVNLCSIELLPDGDGTRLLHTEHGIYLDGYADNGSRFHGIGLQYDKLGETLPD